MTPFNHCKYRFTRGIPIRPPERWRRQRRFERGLSRALEGWQLEETHEMNRVAFHRSEGGVGERRGRGGGWFAFKWHNGDEMKGPEFSAGESG